MRIRREPKLIFWNIIACIAAHSSYPPLELPIQSKQKRSTRNPVQQVLAAHSSYPFLELFIQSQQK